MQSRLCWFERVHIVDIYFFRVFWNFSTVTYRRENKFDRNSFFFKSRQKKKRKISIFDNKKNIFSSVSFTVTDRWRRIWKGWKCEIFGFVLGWSLWVTIVMWQSIIERAHCTVCPAKTRFPLVVFFQIHFHKKKTRRKEIKHFYVFISESCVEVESLECWQQQQ
jgi:hypothetical protein